MLFYLDFYFGQDGTALLTCISKPEGPSFAPFASATDAARVVLDPVMADAGRGGNDAVAISGIRFFNRSVEVV